jgi:chromosome partitioning protein
MSTDAPQRPARVIALMNQKGGVGKTTTTVNLAAALADAGRSALVVDLDPQAHATLHLGQEARQTEASGTVYDLLLDPGAGAEPSTARGMGRDGGHTQGLSAAGCVRPVAANLSAIVSETDLAAAETELAGQPGRHARLRRAIDSLRGAHEFVLIDCPPSLGLLTMNGLVAAQEVLIPMQAHFLALQGVGKLLETVQLVRQQLNAQLRVAGIVLCMHDTQTSHSREVVADLEDFFEQQRGSDRPWASARVYHPPIRRNIKLAECPSFGQTIFQYAPWAPGALDYRKLAETIIAEWDLVLEHLSAEHRARARAAAPVAQPAKPPESRAALTEAEIRVLRAGLGSSSGQTGSAAGRIG